MDVFDLFAKIRLDKSDYDAGLDDAGKKLSGFGNKIKGGLAVAGKLAAAGVGATSTAVGALAKTSLDAYGEYEQLAGGVETLFKSSSGVIMGYADNAYKTAGMSANEYMRTVTSFSASLLQSLDGDTAKAAEKADVAITDMSDKHTVRLKRIELYQRCAA